jgi:hypothetical protein
MASTNISSTAGNRRGAWVVSNCDALAANCISGESKEALVKKRLGWLAFAMAATALVAGTVLYGQGAGGGATGGRRGEGTGAGAFDRERVQLTLELLQLSKPEIAAALKSAEAKWKARQALEEERGRLRTAGDDPQATDQQLGQALANYTKAMGSYRAAVQSEDTALAKKLSVRSRARCLAAGVLDNGLGSGGRSRGGGRGGEGTGSGGGRRGGPGE